MDIVELVEIALANADEDRVDVASLESADIAMEAVSALAQLVAELVDNAVAFSGPEDQVRITGRHDHGDYLVSIADNGVGLPEHLITELNRVLADPKASSGPQPRMGIALVARLAARHEIRVRLVPGAPGTTARVTVPGRLVRRPASGEPEADDREVGAQRGQTERDHRLPPRRPQPEDIFARADEVEETVDLSRFDKGHRSGSGVVAMTEEARREAEAFLERVFSPLVERPGLTERPARDTATNGNGNGDERATTPRPSPPEREKGGTVTALRVRVPGENFRLVADDASTVPAERAVDIRSALARYAEGRRTAEESRENG